MPDRAVKEKKKKDRKKNPVHEQEWFHNGLYRGWSEKLYDGLIERKKKH